MIYRIGATILVGGLACVGAFAVIHGLRSRAHEQRFERAYEALTLDMTEEAVLGLYGGPPHYSCQVGTDRVHYYFLWPPKDMPPSMFPDSAQALGLLPAVCGAHQLLIDADGRLTAYTWTCRSLVVETRTGPVYGNVLGVLETGE